MQQLGADLICKTLQLHGVGAVFGVPGTQNVELFDALRRNELLPTYVDNSELASGFAAIGYFRKSGKVALLTCIPGPGFLFSLPAIAEAKHDSAALILLCPRRGEPSHVNELQRIEQQKIIEPLVKGVFRIDSAESICGIILEAYQCATSGEPGPVYIEVEPDLLSCDATGEPTKGDLIERVCDFGLVEQVARRLASCKRPILYLGGGCWGCCDFARELVRRLQCPTLLTCSARGILGDEDPQHIFYDFSFGGGEAVNKLINSADCVLALGCKFSHNGSGGFSLDLTKDKLLRVDAAAEAFKGDYPASLEVEADLREFIPALLDKLSPIDTDWDEDKISQVKSASRAELEELRSFLPSLCGGRSEEFFERLHQILPSNGFTITTDSGLHQSLVRQFLRVPESSSLICPTDFQSMGFGVPAALGVTVASGEPAIAMIGDGGCLMTGTELSAAKKYSLPLKVIVFSDGHYGLIRVQQLTNYGAAFGTELGPMNLESFARSMGVGYCNFELASDTELRRVFADDEACLIEVRVEESSKLVSAVRTVKAKEQVRKLLGPRLIKVFKRIRGQ